MTKNGSILLLSREHAIIVGCNESDFVPALNVTDQMLIDLDKSFETSKHSTDWSKINDLTKGYESFEDFYTNAPKAVVSQVKSMLIMDDQIVTQIFGQRKLTRKEFNSIKNRFLVLAAESKTSTFGRSAFVTCDDVCTDYSMGVWWDTFWAIQDSGGDMYEANTHANIARGYSYAGCMYGCGGY